MKGFQEGVSPTSGRQSQNKEGRPVTFPEGLCKLSVGVPVQSRAPQQAEGESGMAEEAVGRGHDSGQPPATRSSPGRSTEGSVVRWEEVL